ncbi:MAG: hypothetical protein HN742_40390 [Lentisphaerae bacterium]|nr:hypothetical protein [Lentisphaerota bacterium]MBT5610274.1 hypothetical protein [Lentisphaerota bacterium]MBT7059176.1 hypothetical protein [Lentisphaerota bacterium]MBT7848194.1 hypothetical protein [Lentisphaerota bacterium]
MKPTNLPLTLAALLVSVVATSQTTNEIELLLNEPFNGGLDGWSTAAGTWDVQSGRLIGSDTGTTTVFAYPALLPSRRAITIEATVSINKRLCAGGWSFGGVSILQDGASFWLLSLTESPAGERYVDFLESCSGTWQAQSVGDTRLKSIASVDKSFKWHPNVDYRLRLSLNEDRVTGTVLDANTDRVLCEGAYGFGKTPAVRSGFAGFALRGTQASFDQLSVKAAPSPRRASGIEATRGPKGAVAIFREHLKDMDIAVAVAIGKRLTAEGFGVTYLDSEQACSPGVLSTGLFDLYVIPSCHTYPAAGLDAVATFARERGHILFLGGPFMSNPVWRCDGEWLTADGLQALKSGVAPVHRPFAAGDTPARPWRRATKTPEAPGHWKVATAGPEGTPCLEYWSSAYSGWDGYTSPEIPRLFGEGHGLLTFLAQGDAGTRQIAVEIQETDGSRWIATASVSESWQRVGLEILDFRYWPDSPTKNQRGAPGDQLNPTQARRINFGLASTHTVLVPPGEHLFRVSDIGTAPNPIAGLSRSARVEGFSLETITPSYKVYPVTPSVTLQPTEWATEWGLPNLPDTGDTIMAIPRTSGAGFGRDQKWRYIPLYGGKDDGGHRRGAPVWCLINRTLPYTGSIFACFGFNQTAIFRQPTMLEAVSGVARHIVDGLFLVEGGTAHSAYWPDEAVEAGARVQNLGKQNANVTVTCSFTRAGQPEPFHRNVTEHQLLVRRETTVRDTLVLPIKGPGTCQVRTELRREGRVIDHITQDLSVLDPKSAAPKEFISVAGTDFTLAGKPWYPVGINYWPLYVSGMDHADYWAGWLDHRFYEPALIEEDLGRMADQGMNMVSVQSNDPRFYRNLLDFAQRCKRYGIRINLYCGLASPLAFQEDKLKAFLATSRLHQNPTVFAYDTIWEPGNHVFRGSGRNKWDGKWREWITEHYGSIAQAEQDWEHKPPRDGKGNVTSPPDRYFSKDGEWRVLMAAYRRFMDDLTSRKWNDAHRRLRQLAPNQLVSFRQGNTLPHDFTLTGTPKHIDFICPEGYSIHHSQDGYNAAGFITRYVHFTTGGKPIIWSEFGKSVWNRSAMRMEPDTIAAQGEYHDMFYRMCLESGANGTAPWWWPGGYRVGERSDFGIMNPDYTERPAAALVRKYASALKEPREWPRPTTWMDLDRDAHAGGYWYAAFNTGRDAYRDAVAAGKNLGIRTRGSGTTSANTPLLAVGNRPYTGNNPPKFLNAEANWLRILNHTGVWTEASTGARIKVKRGHPVQIQASMGNTQEATWLAPQNMNGKPGGVYLAATPASTLTGRWPIPADTAYLADADFGQLTLAERLETEAAVELRMTADRRAWFGQKLSFTLVPTP